PHDSQNFAAKPTVAPHEGHERASALPHSGQNRELSCTGAAHTGHARAPTHLFSHDALAGTRTNRRCVGWPGRSRASVAVHWPEARVFATGALFRVSLLGARVPVWGEKRDRQPDPGG